jgi:catechol 2,3-dioxygenase-like lactoylglutathione lyase family enzyme
VTGTSQPARPDVGLSHVALVVADLEASIAFYGRYAGLEVVHRRGEPGREVAWITDGTRPFALVLIEREQVDVRLGGTTHLGVGCASRSEVDRLCALARADGCLISGPDEVGPPVGYMALLRDPNGHNLELAYGQQVSRTVAESSLAGEAAWQPPASG